MSASLDERTRMAPVEAPAPDDSPSRATDHDRSGSGSSPALIGTVVLAVSILAVLALTTVLVLAVSDVPFAAAFGMGLYCAFWLGIGFGTIFASAALFGDDH